ncbi:5'-nucleotidase C-terminal domain-containing protein [Entomospira entomophila]|uniref:Bifunctional metallophosphatase/5'-nucleotidase n=1 Tax=Entomospira entomophila TaxID=2719988 RepID=A0A968GEX5_9SPIO|nr:5'-nucleotidase C-terminal domain-containing protein [Entomospira entomophilus]NIZ41194.1 bifunctional metallophosphatase/5'-nucleotidase [Entomospira entomophilus]WDI35400.1 5'-nucleotidase C-terminal domain-containing protein [Entomospira entomophilus]
MKRGLLFGVVLLLLLGCQRGERNENIVTIQILHTSDQHGKFINYNYVDDAPTTSGSVAAIATKVAQLRKEYPHTILIDTGDTFQDNSNEFFVGRAADNPMLLAMNALNYDSMTVGNHEFNFGIPYLLSLRDHLNMDLLGANVYDAEGERLFKPYKIINKAGVNIAIVGMVTPNITRWDGDKLEGYHVTMPIDEMHLIWPEISEQADLFIFANHMSWQNEYQAGDGYVDLLDAFPEFTVALVAHEHSLIAREEPTGVLVVEPSYQSAYLSQILLTYEKDADGIYQLVEKSVEVIPMRDVQDDTRIVSITQSGHEALLENARSTLGDDGVPIGTLTGGSLVPDPIFPGVSQAQLEMTAMIALINDMQRYYTGANVSSAAVFTPKANMQSGSITKAKIANIYKFDNGIRLYRMNGEQLRTYMEWSAQYFNQFQEGDLTISYNEDMRFYMYDIFGGVLYDVDISQPVGQRITNLRWPDGTTVKDSDTMTLALNDYRAQTTLISELFPNGEVVLVRDLYQEMGDDGKAQQLLLRYIQEVLGGKLSNAIDTTYNQYQIIGYSWDEQLRAKAIELVNQGKISLPMSADGRTPNVRPLRKEDLI